MQRDVSAYTMQTEALLRSYTPPAQEAEVAERFRIARANLMTRSKLAADERMSDEPARAVTFYLDQLYALASQSIQHAPTEQRLAAAQALTGVLQTKDRIAAQLEVPRRLRERHDQGKGHLVEVPRE